MAQTFVSAWAKIEAAETQLDLASSFYNKHQPTSDATKELDEIRAKLRKWLEVNA